MLQKVLYPKLLIVLSFFISSIAGAQCAPTYSILAPSCSSPSSAIIVTLPSLSCYSGATAYNVIVSNSTCTTTAGLSNAGPGTYILNVQPCSAQYVVVIFDQSFSLLYTFFASVVNPLPITPVLLSKKNSSCGSVCDGSLSVTWLSGQAPYNYTVSSLNASSTGSTTSVVAANNLCAGIVTVNVVDQANCTAIYTTAITAPGNMTISTIGAAPLCNGVSNGTLSASVLGGTAPYTYTWLPGNQLTSSVTNVSAGNYTVIVGDAQACVSTQTISISQPAALTRTLTGMQPSCNAGSNGSLSSLVSGGTPPYTYTWLPVAINTGSISNLSVGNYTLLLNDANGCSNSATIALSQPLPLSANISATNPACFGDSNGKLTASAFGGIAPYTYTWLPSTQTGSALANLSAGNYSLVVRDANACFNTVTVTVSQPSSIGVSVSSTNSPCYGPGGKAKSVVFGGTPPYSYTWMPSSANTQSVNSLSAGSHTLFVSDSHSCASNNQTISITQPPQMTISVNYTNVTCFGLNDGAASATVSGATPPYSYTWTPLNVNTPTVSGLIPFQVYTFIASDANFCTYSYSIFITQNPPFTSTVSSKNISCFGLTDGALYSALSGGKPPYTYTWTPLGLSQPTVTNLSAGIYTFTALDSNLCASTKTLQIKEPALFQGTISVTPATCSGAQNGYALATYTGGTAPYTYTWLPAGTASQNNTSFFLSAGVYTVVAADSSACISTNTFTIIENQVNASLTATNVSCNGKGNGSIGVVASSGVTPFTYSWTALSQTSSLVTNVSPGNYTCYVTDAAGCTGSFSVSVTEPPVLVQTTTIVPETCPGCCDATLIVSGSGGVSPYSFALALTGMSSSNGLFNNLCSGVYTINLIDYNMCEDAMEITISPNVTGIKEINAGSIRIYPNPSKGKIKIENTATQVYSITVLDSFGRTIFESDESIMDKELNMVGLKGIYFILLRDQYGRNHIQKIVFE